MSDETEAKRGDAAYREQREAISKRNVEAHKRGQEEKKLRERVAQARDRVVAAREAEQLNELNTRISKRRAGS
ncbi:MAG: hypothetical protein M3340_06195 [Actinomycetota bacterium]|nr:hypothetical protein [Actinomycetota bacterium]